jgi:hypothetical protein
MMQPDSKRPVTLEDILRLKRAERPAAEFWTQFDRELRAKQLAALMQKRPWWKSLSLARFWTAIRRYHLPLGATAALAVTIFSVREYRSPKSAPVSNQVAASVRADLPVTEVAKATTAMPAVMIPEVRTLEATVVPTAEHRELASAQIDPAVLQVAAPTNQRVAFTSEATPSGDLTRLITLAGEPAPVSPSARLIAENFAALQVDETPTTLIGASRAFEARMVARNKPVEPLAQMKVPSNSRRSAMIAGATLISTTAPVVTGEHAVRGLSDERLYETISRVNARGAGMLVKF